MSKHLSRKPTNLINRNRYIIKKLASVSNAERQIILSNAPSELYKAINLIVKILNDDNTKIPKNTKKALKNIKKKLSRIEDLFKTLQT